MTKTESVGLVLVSLPVVAPFGFYNDDLVFQTESYNESKWAAFRLGYPIVDIELLDINFYSAFEEAVNEYSAQVNQMNIQNYLLTFQGQNVSDLGNLTGKAVTGTPLPYIIELCKRIWERSWCWWLCRLEKGVCDNKTITTSL